RTLRMLIENLLCYWSLQQRRREKWLHSPVQPRFTVAGTAGFGARPTERESSAQDGNLWRLSPRSPTAPPDPCEPRLHSFVQSVFTPAPMNTPRQENGAP